MATDEIREKFCLSHFNVSQFSHQMQTRSEDVQIVNNKEMGEFGPAWAFNLQGRPPDCKLDNKDLNSALLSS